MDARADACRIAHLAEADRLARFVPRRREAVCARGPARSRFCAASRAGRRPIACREAPGGAVALEIVEDHDGDTYRAVYTVKFGDAVFVLHAFQKKSKSGIATAPRDIDLIKRRLALAKAWVDEGA